MQQPNPVTAALDLFARSDVESILIGGAAAILHGSARLTYDTDFCCPRDPETFEQLARALNSVHPRFRVEGLPEGMSVELDGRTFKPGQAFSFITDIGNIDVRFDVDGIGGYDKVLALSEDIVFGERTIRMLSLEGIIQSKTAMGRIQDRLILPELEMMREALSVRRLDGLADLPVYQPAAHERVDRSEDRPLDTEASMRILGRSADGTRVFGRYGAGILSVAREAFAHAPAVEDIVLISWENGRDIALNEEPDLGLEP